MWSHAVSALVGSASANEPTTLHVSAGLVLQGEAGWFIECHTVRRAVYHTPREVVTYLL
jgi:hypothetical protein